MKTILAFAGTVLAALAASACCWIPALLGAGAAGSIGISAALAPWRPYLLVLTALFLVGGFFIVYRKPSASCGTGCCVSEAAGRRRRVNIGVMWTVAIFSLAMAAYPEIIATRFRASHVADTAVAVTASRQVLLAIEGMDCEACAASIEENLRKIPGVVDARVDFPKGRAVVRLGALDPTDSDLIAAVKKSGFEAKISHP